MAEAVTSAEREQRVTALELFFDLVFVFAITQVTAFLYHDPGWTRLVQGMAILAALWFAWTGYAWLGNTAGSDGGAMRIVLLAVMGPLLVASLAVPHAFADGLRLAVAEETQRVHPVPQRAEQRGQRDDGTRGREQ